VSSTPTMASSTTPGTPSKVLIVEDEPNALMGLAELISGWGYRTETARDGMEGWEKALAWDPAIVVTDLKMPRLDGIGLLTKLAEEGSGLNANLAVVVLTAMGSIQLAVDAMKLGAYDFLQKPVDATRLRTILANATRQRETEIELEVARRRLRETGVLGALVGNSRVHARDLRPDRADCAVERLGADHRRERHRQGTGGAHAARAEPAQVAALCRGQLRGHS
jgi:DNA-binding NtrC family response regulator